MKLTLQHIITIGSILIAIGGYAWSIKRQSEDIAEIRGKVAILEIKAASFDGNTITSELSKISNELSAIKKDIEWLTKGRKE